MRPQRRPRRAGFGSAPQRAALVLVLAAACASCADTVTQGHLGWGPREVEAERSCQRGAIAACGELGRWLVARTEAELDVQRGLVLLEIACGQDDLLSCAALGRMYLDHDHDRARARARAVLTPACDRRSAQACTALGDVLEIDHADRSEVVGSFQKGCALGDAEGCERFGQAQWRDTFGDGRARAEEAFGRACGLGRPASCHLLAMVVARDPARQVNGVKLLQQNCDRGYVPSCSALAASFAPLLSGQPDCRLAQPLAQKACDGKVAEACVIADACALAGPARPAALESLRLACERGVGTACLYWADAQLTDAGGDRVERAYEIACRAHSRGTEVACLRLAVIALGRAKLSVDAERPLAELREACEHESGEACCELGGEYERGKWIPADAVKAAELRVKACSLGHDRCCRPPPSPPTP